MRRGRAAGLAVVLTLATGALWPAGTAMAGGGGCYGGPTEGTGDTIEMAEACFTPSLLRVDPGTEVTFVNLDPYSHNVSAIEWGSPGDLKKGNSFTTTFAEEGTFPYACMYHYGMTGAVVVGDGAGPASAVPVSTESVSKSKPLSQETAVTSAANEGSGAIGWAVSGGIGLLIGAGLGGLLLRRRREA
jgi:plastocyanin